MKKLISIFALGIMIGCGNPPQQSKTFFGLKTRIGIPHFYIPPQKEIIPVSEEIPPMAKTIPWDIYEMRPLSLPDPFNSYDALFKLFPGKYVQADNRTSISWWTSPKTKRKYFIGHAAPWSKGIDWEFPTIFPTEECQTTHLATLRFTNSLGEDCILFSTNSGEYGGGILNCGRFSGGILGMALFIKRNNEWVLEKFNPAIGSYGSFSNACEPIGAKKQERKNVFHFHSANGGPGGPYFGSEFIITESEKSFIEACWIENSSYDLRPSFWNTQIEFVNGADDYPIVVATKEGEINGEDETLIDIWDRVPAGIKTYAKHHFKFKFREIKTYIYEDERYVLTDTKTEVWDKQWKVLE